jgi:hypothetical protein
MKYDTSKLKPFDLERAKAGDPVCTREGYEVRIICFDREGNGEKKLIALLKTTDNIESVFHFLPDGSYFDKDNNPDSFDLMMAPKTVTKWVNVYKKSGFLALDGNIHDTENEAKECIESDYPESDEKENYIATAKIEWEE